MLRLVDDPYSKGHRFEMENPLCEKLEHTLE